MLLLLLLAKGWAVTRQELTWKPLVFAIWLCYGIVHILLYVWNLVLCANVLETFLIEISCRPRWTSSKTSTSTKPGRAG